MSLMPEDTTAAAADAAMEAALAETATKTSARGAAADQKIAELQAQLRDASERALRAQAELENYRKRSQRELAEERRYAVVPLVRDLLPVVDNLERAIAATQTRSVSEGHTQTRSVSEGHAASAMNDDVSSLLAGVKLVASQLEAVLKQHQCVRIETVGAPFDPNQHQAIAQEPSEEYPAGTVTRAAQVGYKLYDRVIRPAQVFVSTGPPVPPV
jgi:molecular chaperone GrpE